MNKLAVIYLLLLVTISACQEEEPDQSDVNQINTSQRTTLINDDFSQKNLNWEAYSGQWKFQKGTLIQTSENDDFPVILLENAPLTDVDVQVRFKPISGKIDASGGIIFRAEDEDNYYIVRANALENNFRLYTFVDGYRHQLASTTVTPPALGKFSTMRVITKGNHIQAFLNDKLELDYHDDTFKQGYVGLWTKADSITEFDDFKLIK